MWGGWGVRTQWGGGGGAGQVRFSSPGSVDSLLVFVVLTKSSLVSSCGCCLSRGLRVKRTKKQDTKPNKGLRHFSVKVCVCLGQKYSSTQQ